MATSDLSEKTLNEHQKALDRHIQRISTRFDEDENLTGSGGMLKTLLVPGYSFKLVQQDFRRGSGVWDIEWPTVIGWELFKTVVYCELASNLGYTLAKYLF